MEVVVLVTSKLKKHWTLRILMFSEMKGWKYEKYKDYMVRFVLEIYFCKLEFEYIW